MDNQAPLHPLAEPLAKLLVEQSVRLALEHGCAPWAWMFHGPGKDGDAAMHGLSRALHQLLPQGNFEISQKVLEKAAQAAYGAEAQVSEPYWADHERLRVGIYLPSSDASFGANFFYKEGVMR